MASHYLSRQDAWNFFYNLFGGNEYAAAGACGNMQHESGLASDNAENLWNQQTGYSDEWLTNGINDGSIDLSEFLQKEWYVNKYGFGYGLSQWTSSDRRTKLWNRTRTLNLPIDDIDAQLGYITWEFTDGSWAGVRTAMMQAHNVKEATLIYCKQYEGGAWSQNRETYANQFYDDFAGTSSGYGIIITIDGNGTAWSSINEVQVFTAEAGQRVELGAVANDSDYFLLWTVDYPSTLVLEQPITVADNFFTMPASKVNLTAHFTGETPEPPPYPPFPPTPELSPKESRLKIWDYPYTIIRYTR